jgi:hypothetical protein
MRWLALFILLSARLSAGAWSLDVGLAAGVGGSAFTADPAGLDPSTFIGNPKVSAYSKAGLIGSAGLDLSLQRKRRWGLGLQVLWEGHSLVMDELLDFGSTTLDRQTVWEWQSLAVPLTLSYALPLWSGPKEAVLGRFGLGAFADFTMERHKTLSSGVGTPIERPWAGPAQDYGPLASIGLDWIARPSGKRVVSFELRGLRGTAAQDPAAGAGLPVWAIEGVLSVPIWMKVL